jgi:hypothetical protein
MPNETGKEVAKQIEKIEGEFQESIKGLSLSTTDHLIRYGRFLLERLAKSEQEVDRLRAGLDEAIHTIRVWHGMGEPKEQEEFLWKVYSEQSPEMKRIMSARKVSP